MIQLDPLEAAHWQPLAVATLPVPVPPPGPNGWEVGDSVNAQLEAAAWPIWTVWPATVKEP